MHRLNSSGNQQVCRSIRCNGNGTYESEATSYPVNHQQVKTSQTIKTDTKIRHGISHSGRNICTNTISRHQQNTLATYPSTLFTDINTKCVLLLSDSCVGTEITSSMADAVSDCCVCFDILPRLELLVVGWVTCCF